MIRNCGAFLRFYEPASITNKTIFNHFMKNGINQLNSLGEVLPEYKSKYEVKFQDFLPDAADEFQNLMNRYNFPQFTASIT